MSQIQMRQTVKVHPTTVNTRINYSLVNDSLRPWSGVGHAQNLDRVRALTRRATE